MPEKPAFQELQFAFAGHIRDPENNAAPEGIEDRRMAIYRQLFFNNVSQLLSRTFPILFRILGQDRWEALIRDYFSRHRSHTPLFLEMPREFLQYLEKERGQAEGDPPFLYELAHYEWVELALSIDEREPDPASVDPRGDLLDGRP
ncbi:MAG: putative DNA-binding domain-containing protein, partial [Gammaproteobacteria bacterium]